MAKRKLVLDSIRVSNIRIAGDLPRWIFGRRPKVFCLTFTYCFYQVIYESRKSHKPKIDTACTYNGECVFKTDKPWWER